MKYSDEEILELIETPSGRVSLAVEFSKEVRQRMHLLFDFWAKKLNTTVQEVPQGDLESLKPVGETIEFATKSTMYLDTTKEWSELYNEEGVKNVVSSLSRGFNNYVIKKIKENRILPEIELTGELGDPSYRALDCLDEMNLKGLMMLRVDVTSLPSDTSPHFLQETVYGENGEVLVGEDGVPLTRTVMVSKTQPDGTVVEEPILKSGYLGIYSYFEMGVKIL